MEFNAPGIPVFVDRGITGFLKKKGKDLAEVNSLYFDVWLLVFNRFCVWL